MEIFTIIMFGLLTMKSLVPFSKEETFKKLPDLLASIIILICNVVAYVWFIRLIINTY